MGMNEKIRARLETAFNPRTLVVRDDSERHRGHAGYREGGESHWFVEITADAFGPMTRLERHRAVHAALGEEIVGRIHALQLKIAG